MSTPAELLQQSLAKLQAANRVDGSRNSYRKDNPTEYDKVIVYLKGGARPTGVTSDMGMGLMLEEDARRSLTVQPEPGPAPEPVPTPEPEPTPEPPPVGKYPASYYTGPLGATNILPVDPAGALLILWPGDVTNWTLATWKTRIQEREAACGRRFDGIGIHYGGGGTFGGAASCAWINPTDAKEQFIHSRGSVPMVSWSPSATIAQINAGERDACFTNVANYFKGLGFRIMLRLFWEFDGTWMPWKATVGQEAAWRSAWQRVVGLFDKAGATNVGFWWTPTSWFNQPLRNACYPGDEYVDWVGADGYNQASSSVQTSPLHAGWVEFWEMYNPTGHGSTSVSIHNQYGPRKPFVVGETGCLYDSSNAGRKAQWYRNIDAHGYAKPDMPYLHGIQFFDVNLVTTEGFDWKVDNNQTYAQKQNKVDGSFDANTYQGFKDFAKAARWNVGVIGGAT